MLRRLKDTSYLKVHLSNLICGWLHKHSQQNYKAHVTSNTFSKTKFQKLIMPVRMKKLNFFKKSLLYTKKKSLKSLYLKVIANFCTEKNYFHKNNSNRKNSSMISRKSKMKWFSYTSRSTPHTPVYKIKYNYNCDHGYDKFIFFKFFESAHAGGVITLKALLSNKHLCWALANSCEIWLKTTNKLLLLVACFLICCHNDCNFCCNYISSIKIILTIFRKTILSNPQT